MKKWTCIGFLSTILIWLVTTILDLDLFESLIAFTRLLERFEIDELFLLSILPILGLLRDLTLQKRAEQNRRDLAEHRLRIIRATVNTIEDVLGNKLLSLKFKVARLHERKEMPTCTHDEITDTIQDMLVTIRELHDLSNAKEKELAPGLEMFELDNSM